MTSRYRTRFRRLALATLGLPALLVACAQPPLKPDATPEQRAQAQAFAARCSACHALPAPRRHTYREWQLLLGIMEQRMSERGMHPLSDEDRSAILAYLERHGR